MDSFLTSIDYIMKNLLFLLVGFISTAAGAQTSVYKISKGDRSIYLGGTVHLLRAQDYPLPAGYETAYKNSDVLTFETDTQGLQDPAVSQKMMSQGMYQDERTLKTVLVDSIYEKLRQAFAQYNLPFEMMQKMKPALAVTTLSAMGMQKMGMSAQGVDMYYTQKARVDKKELQHLESVQDQINRITTMADGNENEFVNYSLRDMEGMEKEMTALIENWKTGAADKMMLEIESMQSDFPETYKSLLVERNNNWMPQILSYLENGTRAFVLVGSLHLHGPDGLLALLKNQGYQIEQL